MKIVQYFTLSQIKITENAGAPGYPIFINSGFAFLKTDDFCLPAAAAEQKMSPDEEKRGDGRTLRLTEMMSLLGVSDGLRRRFVWVSHRRGIPPYISCGKYGKYFGKLAAKLIKTRSKTAFCGYIGAKAQNKANRSSAVFKRDFKRLLKT